MNADKTFEETIRELVRLIGIEAMKDGHTLRNTFLDIAPKQKKEQAMLTYLIQCDGHTALIEAASLEEGKRQAAVGKIEYRLCNDFLLAEDIAKDICEQFINGMSASLLTGKKVSSDSILKQQRNVGIYEGDPVNFDGSVQYKETVENGRSKITSISSVKNMQETYESSAIDCQRNRHGKMEYPNGDVYEGDFMGELPQGKGKLTRSNGDVYIGEFRNGKIME